MKVQISCFWSLTRPELAGASVSFPRFLIWKRKFVFNIFRWGLWAPPLFFIGLKNVFFAGFPESIDIYTDRKVKNLLFQKKILFFIYFYSYIQVKCFDYSLLRSFFSSTPLTHSFWSVLFTGLAQNVCPFERVLLPNSFYMYFLRLLAMRVYISWEGWPEGLYRAWLFAPSGST